MVKILKNVKGHIHGLFYFWTCFLLGVCLVSIVGMGGSPAVLFVPGLFYLLSNLVGMLYLVFLGFKLYSIFKSNQWQ